MIAAVLGLRRLRGPLDLEIPVRTGLDALTALLGMENRMADAALGKIGIFHV